MLYQYSAVIQFYFSLKYCRKDNFLTMLEGM